MSVSSRNAIITTVGVAAIMLVVGVAIGSIAFPATQTETSTLFPKTDTTTISSATTVTEVPFTNTIASTQLTYIQISGSSHPVFYVTEVVVVQPEVVNEVCSGEQDGMITNTTIQSTYNLPSQIINESNAIGFITTSTLYQNYTTHTLYENATFVEIESNNTATYTEINSHYNVTQTGIYPVCP